MGRKHSFISFCFTLSQKKRPEGRFFLYVREFYTQIAEESICKFETTYLAK